MNHSRYTSQEEAETVVQVLEKFPRFYWWNVVLCV